MDLVPSLYLIPVRTFQYHSLESLTRVASLVYLDVYLQRCYFTLLDIEHLSNVDQSPLIKRALGIDMIYLERTIEASAKT